MNKKFLFSLVILLLVIGLTGCKSPEEKAAEKIMETSLGNGVDVNIDNDGQEMKFKDEASGDYIATDADGDMDLPKAWPSELSICNECKIISVVDMGPNLQVIALTDEMPVELKKWYKKMSEDAGWVEKNVMDTGGMLIMTYTKNGTKVNYTISPDEDSDKYMVSHVYTK